MYFRESDMDITIFLKDPSSIQVVKIHKKKIELGTKLRELFTFDAAFMSDSPKFWRI